MIKLKIDNFKKFVEKNEKQLTNARKNIEALKVAIEQVKADYNEAVKAGNVEQLNALKAKQSELEITLAGSKEVIDYKQEFYDIERRKKLINILNSKRNIPKAYDDEAEKARIELFNAINNLNKAVAHVDDLNKKIYREQYDLNCLYNEFREQDEQHIDDKLIGFKAGEVDNYVYPLGSLVWNKGLNGIQETQSREQFKGGN